MKERCGLRLGRLAERLALDVSDRAAQRALTAIRRDMSGARLGRLGQAITMTSDKRKGGKLYRRGDVARASGVIYIRSKSPRTVGAIISYTEGAQINPIKGQYLWIPTDSAQRLVGKGKARTRLTPATWESSGMAAKLGPLFRITSARGNPVLVVRNVGVSGVAGGSRRPRGLTKSGRPRKGDVAAELVPIFTGIPRTSRAARVNPRRRAFEAAQQAAAELRGV